MAQELQPEEWFNQSYQNGLFEIFEFLAMGIYAFHMCLKRHYYPVKNFKSEPTHILGEKLNRDWSYKDFTP